MLVPVKVSVPKSTLFRPALPVKALLMAALSTALVEVPSPTSMLSRLPALPANCSASPASV
ncbi:MAG: hypothetical protein BGP23_14610 [Lysobacterales bacterium 66-474]|nr:MAG: hypothetical protein BGP23_14610 [Xanthomonadales bacterium 66-474]